MALKVEECGETVVGELCRVLTMLENEDNLASCPTLDKAQGDNGPQVTMDVDINPSDGLELSIQTAPKPDSTEDNDSSLPKSPKDKILLCKDILSKGHICPSLDGNVAECTYGSDSDSIYTSDPEVFSDDEDDSDESVLCLTSHGTRHLDTTDTLRPPLPRRLSFKPLEAADKQDSKHEDSPPHNEASVPNPAPLVIASLSPGEIFHNEFFTVATSLTAGMGAFATVPLRPGTILLAEKPLLTADSRTLFREFAKLDRPRREVATSLHINERIKAGTPIIEAVWNTNCFAVSSSGKAGLFPIAARFNHACAPKNNVHYEFVPELGVLLLRARRAVSAGEELTITYGIGRTPRDLYLRYGFRCRCGACPGLSDWEFHKLNSPW